MKTISTMKKSLSRLLVSIALLVIAAPSQAGGPLEICESGVPYLWPDGGNNVPFNPDQGALGILDSTAAVQAVTDAYQAWTDVPTATINYSNEGLLPVDVDITNFTPFLQATDPDGLSAIVFDDTGEIFDLLFGPGSGILGFAGPEFLDEPSCTIVEGFSFLNGPAITSLEGLLDLMVHEFGHYSNLAHTEVNGQIYANSDSSGPGTDTTTFGPVPDPTLATTDVIETMFPFLFSDIDQIARTPHADDAAILSRLYPQADFAANTASISGTIFFGDTKLTGINVIARNLSDPYEDAVSAISSDFTRDYSQADAITGTYTLTGLTPGAEYALFVNGLLSGADRFSTPAATPPGPEEYFNGANESGDGSTDIPLDFTIIAPVAGAPVTDIDISFNLPVPGEPLNTGDDGNVALPLPFEFCIAGQGYSQVFVNGNGFLTFGAADDSFLNFSENAASLLSGPPRIAAFWDDLSPNVGGSVSFDSSGDTFTVTWDSVPEFGIADGTSSNTFSIQLRDNSYLCGNRQSGVNRFNWFQPEVQISHGEMTASDGLVGVSSGIAVTSQFETESDLSADRTSGFFGRIQLLTEAAKFELFSPPDEFDLADSELKFIGVGIGYLDRYERRTRGFKMNNSLENASPINLPFDSKNTFRDYTALSPSSEDVDFYLISQPLTAGTTLVAEVVTGQIDSVLGLYRCNNLSDDGRSNRNNRYYNRYQQCDSDQAELVASNDDSNGLLSKITFEVPEDGVYAIAVSYFGDLDFDGEDPGQGDPFDGGRYVLDAFVIDGSVIELGDDAASEIELGFDFDFQGAIYDSVFVNSNGFLTFGGDAASEFLPNLADLESGLPRIAPLWTDLNPSAQGIIFASPSDGVSKTITFSDVPEFALFGGGGANSFAVTLNASGAVSIGYGEVSADTGIAGLAEGGGAAVVEVDLSAATDLSSSGSTAEEFVLTTNEFDLDGAVIEFAP